MPSRRFWQNARVNTDAVTLRLADAGDAETIAQMSRDLIESGLGWRYRTDRVRRMITRRDTSAVVACDRHGTVGFGVMQCDDEHAHLMLLAVRPSHQRQGVARQLMQWLLHSARVAGMVSVHLELRASNRAALHFYRSLGFAQTLVLAGYYEQRESAIRMMCLLRAPDEQPHPTTAASCAQPVTLSSAARHLAQTMAKPHADHPAVEGLGLSFGCVAPLASEHRGVSGRWRGGVGNDAAMQTLPAWTRRARRNLVDVVDVMAAGADWTRVTDALAARKTLSAPAAGAQRPLAEVAAGILEGHGWPTRGWRRASLQDGRRGDMRTRARRRRVDAPDRSAGRVGAGSTTSTRAR
jgi:ribosomal protein S18 acetylase RimI-like enzyme